MFPPQKGSIEIQREPSIYEQEKTRVSKALAERFEANDFDAKDEKVTSMQIQSKILLSYHGAFGIRQEEHPRETIPLETTANVELDFGQRAMILPSNTWAILAEKGFDPMEELIQAKTLTLLVALDHDFEQVEGYELAENCSLNTTTVQESSVEDYESQ